ncbi:MAG: hypothetical protein Q9O74_05815 [Planctomycetota bacterium]|nr:hypothetical protein [Planctomycetota bacterium]
MNTDRFTTPLSTGKASRATLGPPGSPGRAARFARAFSLVEVLIAVLVLSLGLLGLGAVFPMVMREQRISTQTTLGISARNAVEQMLFSRSDFARDGGPGWEALREYVITNGGDTGNWVAVEPDDSDFNQLNTYIFTHPDTGDEYYIPLAQRLYPIPYSTDQDPRFVWDLVARLTDFRNPDTSPLLVAVFLRPLDPGIKTAIDPNAVPRAPYSVLSTLIDPTVPPRERRNPVSADGQGRPTQDGRRDRGAEYAKPIVAEATIGPGIGNSPDIFDSLIVQRVLESSLRPTDAAILISVPGQHFLDFQGRVYEVTAGKNILGRVRTATFSPAISDVDGNGNVDTADYNPIVFLPQASHVKPIVFTVQP